MSKSSSDNFENYIEEYYGQKEDFKGLLHQHYSSDILDFDKAKHEYIEPDLLTF